MTKHMQLVSLARTASVLWFHTSNNTHYIGKYCVTINPYDDTPAGKIPAFTAQIVSENGVEYIPLRKTWFN